MFHNKLIASLLLLYAPRGQINLSTNYVCFPFSAVSCLELSYLSYICKHSFVGLPLLHCHFSQSMKLNNKDKALIVNYGRRKHFSNS